MAHIVGSDATKIADDILIHHVQTDSRLPFREGSLFVALTGPNHDGHDFLPMAQSKGAAAALVDRTVALPSTLQIPCLKVGDPLTSFQNIAAHHHHHSGLPTLAVTGSNGKTIFKDLLVSILSHKFNITASPGSFNSQIGVALSLLQLNSDADLAIVEAGISRPGEMKRLEAMIRPKYGVLTNIGYAHLEGLGTQARIAEEKSLLFKNLPSDGWLLTPTKTSLPPTHISHLRCPHHVFAEPASPSFPKLLSIRRLGTNLSLTEWLFREGETQPITMRVDAAWSHLFETILAAVTAARLLGCGPNDIAASLSHFEPPQNCLELWESQQGFTLINDAYSSDPISVRAGLATLGTFTEKRRVFLFGGMMGLGDVSAYQHALVGEEAARQKVDWLVTVGKSAGETRAKFSQKHPRARVDQAVDLEGAISLLEPELGPGDALLIKGPRQARFADAAQQLKGQLSPTSFTVNLSKIRHNLLIFQALFKSEPKIMAMVKAFAYGMDAAVVARYLQTIGVSHFGVAYLREAQALRIAGIYLPIVVQLVLAEESDAVVRQGLQPVVFDESVTKALSRAAEAQGKQVRIHIKIDTGMGRFGLFPQDLPAFLKTLKRHPNLTIEGVMTHFSSADDPEADDFTRGQLAKFGKCLDVIKAHGYEPPLIHAAATAAATRFPEARFTMVRLGLGLYGVAPTQAVRDGLPAPLVCPFALRSKLGFVKDYPAGYPINYNRRFKTERPSRIGFIPMGYHDGLSCGLANRGHVKIGSFDAPMVGSICMDFTAVDVTDIPDAKPGSPVLILGSHRGRHLPVEAMAKQLNTIPYEVLSRLSPRVQRVYIIEER